jgi:hypothetical protein
LGDSEKKARQRESPFTWLSKKLCGVVYEKKKFLLINF